MKSRRAVEYTRHDAGDRGSRRMYAYGSGWIAWASGLSCRQVCAAVAKGKLDPSTPSTVIGWILTVRGWPRLGALVVARCSGPDEGEP